MSDNIFVSRDNNIYQIDMTSSGSLRDTDLVLASREVNGVPTLFKVTGDKFGKSPAAPEIAAVVLQQNSSNANRFTGNSFTSIVGSNEESPTAPTLMTAEVEGALSIEAATEPITTNAYSSSSETSVPLTLDGTFNLGDPFEVGDVVLANESYSPTTSTIAEVSAASVTTNGTTATATGWGNNDFPLDGNVGTQAPSQNNTSGVITFSQDLQNVTKVEVNTRFLSTGTATLSEGGTTVATKSFTGSFTQDWFTIYEGPPISFDKYEQQMEYQGTPTSDDFYAMRINDQFVVCPGGTGTVMNPITSPNTIIELEDNTDIQLFQTGDLISQESNFNQTEQWSTKGHTYGGTYYAGSFTQLFDAADSGLGGRPGSFFVSLVDLPATTTENGLIVRASSQSGTCTVTTNNGNYGIGNANVEHLIECPIGTQMTGISWGGGASGDGCGITYIKVDGKRLVDEGLPGATITNVTVVSTNVGTKQVTVDGGSWSGTDGSGQADGKTQVTLQSAKRGEGTIKAINGTAVTIEPFVDNCFKKDQFLVFKTPKVIEVTPLTDPIQSFDSQTNTLTLTGDKDLSQLANGDSVYMTDGTAPVNQDGYLLQTSTITNIVNSTVNSIDMIDRSKSGAERNDYPFTNFFDGSFSTFYYMGPDAVGLYLDIDIPAGSTVELYGNNGASDTQTITVRYNDGATTGSFTKSSANQWRDCSPEDQTIEITNMFIETVGNYGGWAALRINGEIVGTTYSSPTELTFADPCPDLQYFELQDVVQTSPEIKVLDINTANRTMKVTPGGTWANNSQVWSDPSNFSTSTNFYAEYPSTMLFDGNPATTFYATGQGSSITWDASSFFAGTGSHTVRVRMSETITSDKYSGNIDGTPFVMRSDSPWSEPLTVNSIGVITVSGTSNVSDGAWTSVEVDGKLLVDTAIDSKIWSDQASGTFNVNGQPEKLFDGDISTGIYSDPGSQGQIDLTGITGVTKLEAYWYTGTSGNWSINVGGQDININSAHPSAGGGSGTLQWVDLTSLFTTPFDFGVLKTSTTGEGYMAALKVNDKFVLDSGVRTGTKVTYQTNGGEGTVSTVVNDSIIIVPTGDRDNRWIGTNAAGTVFRAGSPTKPAISQKAYLKFTGAGVVEGISAAPVEPQAMSSRNPTLIFPSEFDTNTTPDAELPDPTSLKTTISRTNELGSSTASSNKLFPTTTTTRSELTAGAAAAFTTDGYAEFVCMALSHEGRAAEQRAIQYAENCQALKDAAEQKAQDYINNNP